MSIISALATYLATYSGLETGAPVWVDYLGPKPTEYSVAPLSGTKVIERYLDGGSLREFSFAFRVAASTSDNAERINTLEFYEAFSDWLDAQTEAGTLPTLGTKKKASRIEALEDGYLFEQGQSETGDYQVVCKITYEQEA